MSASSWRVRHVQPGTLKGYSGIHRQRALQELRQDMPVHPASQPCSLFAVAAFYTQNADLKLHQRQRGDVKARRVMP